MSLIELVFSRREILLSFMLVAAILVFALGVMVIPPIVKRWKHMRKERQARTAQRAQARKRRRAAQPKRPSESPTIAAAAPMVESPAVAPSPKATAVVVNAEPPTPEPAAVPPSAPIPDESAETAPSAEVQTILESIFAVEENDGRFETLMHDVNVATMDEIAALAAGLAAKLRAASR
jgi:hypothetical protein